MALFDVAGLCKEIGLACSGSLVGDDIIKVKDLLKPGLVVTSPEQDELSAEALVRSDGLLLRKIHPSCQTERVCMAAVCENGLALKYVIKQTPSIAKAALTQNANAWPYVEQQTTQLSQIAFCDGFTVYKDIMTQFGQSLKRIVWDGRSLQYHKRADALLCLKVVITNMDQMFWEDVRGDAVFWRPVIRLYHSALARGPKLQELLMLGVTESGLALEHVPKEMQTLAICVAGIKQNPKAVKFVKIQLPDSVYEDAVRDNPNVLPFTPTSLHERLSKIVIREFGHLYYASIETIRDMCGITIINAILARLVGSREEKMAQICRNTSLSAETKSRLLSILL